MKVATSAMQWVLLAVLAKSGAVAAATPECSVQALQQLKVPKVTVTAAKLVPAAGGAQAHCDVQASVVTEGEGAPPGSAGIGLVLPASFSGHFMFGGGRGTGGNLGNSANKPDIDVALAKGYASVTTDSGHTGREENWYYVGKPGVPNYPKLTDYYYRATHQATLASKEFVKSYYGQAITHAYFNGCSNGGRQAITEAVRYPDDFDGIIVGCPWLDPAGSALLNVQRTKSFLDPVPTAAAPWGEGKNESHNWNSARGVIQDLAFNDEGFDLNNGIFDAKGLVKPELLKSLYDKLGVEVVADPAKLQAFLKKGGKILMYHGLSDVTINGFGTILYYEALADQGGGYDKLRDQVRLFLVSGMQHCNDGPDPVFFDTLTAMENWVEKGVAPNTMIAQYTTDNGKTNTRTLPLCPFPIQARYSGNGDVNDAKNWSCPAGDKGMLEVARNGKQAGMQDNRTLFTARFRNYPTAVMKQ